VLEVIQVLESLIAAFKIPDLKKRIYYVFMMFGVFVVGLHIPVPGIDREAMEKLFAGGNFLNLLDVFSGGAFKKFTIFAMGITPYINASIIMQLLTIALPQLEQLAKEGEAGRKKISQYTRYLTGVLAFVQAFGLCVMLSRMGVFTLAGAGWLTFVQIAITLTAGTAFLMWMGEQITDKGIGQGVSLVIFCSILARMPTDVMATYKLVEGGSLTLFNIILLLATFVLTVMGIVFITQGTRKIPIQHSNRVVGYNRMVGGTSSHLPLKVNAAGVIPIIFAISILMFPATIAQFVPTTTRFGEFVHTVVDFFTPGRHWFASVVYATFVVFFTYFYTAVTINVPQLSDDLKKWGSFIPGIRPGKPTAEYLDRVMTRITLAGALFLAAIALLQYYVPSITGVQTFTLVGGTSLLIVVGVALDTMQSIEAHLVMRNYEGFIK